MSVGLLFDCDAQVADHLFRVYQQPIFKFDRCLGLVGANDSLIGCILFHNWNGSNVELSYYGSKALSSGIIKCLARFIICTFSASRLTVTVSKRKRGLLKSLQRFGFKLEGTQRCYYGKRDCSRNTGVRFVMFRDRLEALAHLPPNDEKAERSC